MRCLLFAVLLLGFTQAPLSAAADRYQVEGYLLPNGLQVLLKPGTEPGHVAIRLVVGVGFDDFNCANQELPHLLEHLMFSGVDGSGEGGLETRMQALGGEWNAFTGDSDTTFVIEAPARNQRKVLDLLLEAITKTHIDQQALETAKAIVTREDGGHSSHLQTWLDHQDVGHSASNQLAIEMGLKCSERASVDALTLEQVNSVRQQWYASNNMSLIVVGQLDKLLPAYLDRAWGALPAAKPVDHPDIVLAKMPAERRRALIQGWLGDSVQLHWFFLEPSLEDVSDDAFDLVQSYLDWALYSDLRLTHGLSYGPSSQREAFGDSGLMSLNADLDHQDLDRAQALVGQLVERLQRDGMDPAVFSRLKQAAIDHQAWAIQGDSGLADYYWGALADYADGRFADPAQGIRKVTLAEADKALKQLLSNPAYVRIEKPLLNYDQVMPLLACVGLLALLLLAGVLWLIPRRRRHPKEPGLSKR
jgi:predicted Zn-dependent peptidase